MEIRDSISAIIRKMPQDVLKKNELKAMTYFLRDVALAILLSLAIVVTHSWTIGLVLSVLLGMTLMGLFVLGHDAGHRSFSKSETLNDLIGHLTTTFCLWPFHVWRLSHDIHHRHTHNIEKEIAWRPLTLKQYERRNTFFRWFYRATRTYAMPLSSFVFTLYFFRDGLLGRRSRYFEKKDLQKIRLSITICLIATAGMAWGSYMLGGIYGVICLFVIPQAVFQFWLSIFTYFHHTTAERQMHATSSWTMEKAQLAGTIHVNYPRIVEWFCHDINWHVPHHVCVGVPHYNLRRAHSALKKAYPDIVKEMTLNLSEWKASTGACHLVRGKQASETEWMSFDEAHAELENRKLQPALSL